jgi:hypothetical protein
MVPAANPVPSFWNAEPRPLDDFRSTKDLPSEIDILIIGSGIAGVGTAYHLLQDSSFKASIAILEARKPVSGATGRNGGHVKPDGFLNVQRTAKIYGAEAAAELAKFEAAHVYAVKDLVERECLDCDFNVTRALDVFLDPKHAKQTEEAYRELVKANVVDLHDIAFTPKKDAERVKHLVFILLHSKQQLTGIKTGFWCQGRAVLFFLYSRPLVAIKDDPSTPTTSPRQRRQAVLSHARIFSLVNS